MGSPNADEARETAITVTELPLALIRPGNNDRHVFSESELDELAASITEVGLVQPVTVRRVLRSLDGTEYELVAGERRFRAHQRLGKPTIRALVEDLPDEKAAVVMLVENLQRTDLNPMEEAEAYQARIDRFDLDIAALSKMSGVGQVRIQKRLSLLRLCPEAQHLIRTGQMKPGPGSRLAGLDANRQMLAVAAFRAEPNMKWQDWAEICSRLREERDQDALFDPDDLLQVEEFLLDTLDRSGNRRRTRGYILDLLGRICDRLLEDDPLVVEARQIIAYDRDGRLSTRATS